MRCVTLDNTMKNGPKFFVIVKTAMFWKVCFCRHFRYRRKDIIICSLIVKIPCGTMEIVHRYLSIRIFSPLEMLPFSEKACVLTTSKFLKNWSYYIHSKCQNTLSTLINCSLRFFILDITRKTGQTIFFTGKIAVFSKVCF